MRTVIITGSAAGIGKETAKLFARKGDRVIIADIDRAGAEAAAAEIKAHHGHAVPYALDVSSEQQWVDFAQWVGTEFGSADVLVNNAGVMDIGGFVETSAAQWQRTVDIDLMSVVYGSKVFGQQMIDAGVRGHIVNISSGAAFLPSKLISAYGVAKAAVLMATQCLRIELRPHGIGVTAICPGAIRTNLLAHGQRHGLVDKDPELWREDMLAVQTGLAYAGPDKVARVIERSVRRNWAIVPVNPEAWFIYGLMRFSPGLVRWGASVISFDLLERLLERLRPLINRLAQRKVGA
ncbi:SDR family NAD(P)-dependent oxidoreductase [Mycobacteroides chelonae]|uniref:Oxidoreductase n=1 Tax=Mycobacteroides chelonae TaxID=1774 RepID=A0A1S1M624_MYCCH|nr:SDR family NAD(P)-dependent oxidoreductase [Mycobacteroides chelonae]OHU53259.1 oxidoreductase [Mycobacteroides chelonae]OHU78177.1 oxidoreductase [Mycobacteroides chelonae]QQG86639.1 SDR family NAD(P)-dependent oxidoreductase [Mycobacteroides chelonae]QQG91456.1 SDR family NAD(P)-dependent oxidoreductase [Mycobacteroides chelonae]